MRLITFLLLLTISVKGLAQNLDVKSLEKELTKHSQLDTGRVSLLVQLANAELFDHPTKSATYAVQAFEISQKINYTEGVALSYQMLGNSFRAQANLSDALHYFLKAMQIADSIHSEQVRADLLGNIGMVYSDMGDYAAAMTHYRQSLSEQIKLKNNLREVVILINMGIGYYRMKKADSALYCYNQSITKLQSLKNTRMMGDLLNIHIGDVYSSLGKYDEAMVLFHKAKLSSDTTRHHRNMIHARQSIAKVLMAKNQLAPAEKELLECVQLASEVHLNTYSRDAYELLYLCAERQGNSTQSFDYFKKYTNYKDSIENMSEESRIVSMRLEYEMQKKMLEIDVLKKETEIQTEELKIKSMLLYFSIALLSLLVVFIYYVVKNNKLLQARNHEISRQQVELLTLNEELTAQGEEVMAQRDALFEKHQQIEQVNQQMALVNENLEKLVKQRTQALEEQNKKLSDYAFFNAHKLRAPLARVLGLTNLLMSGNHINEHPEILRYLKESSEELDSIVRSVSTILDEGINAFPKNKNNEDRA